MKKFRWLVVLMMVVMSVTLVAGFAVAAEKISVKGKIKDFNIDEKTVTVTTDDGKDMTFVIENEKALNKLDDRLFKGDEVKIKYVIENGKNVIKENNDMRGTKPGC